MRSRRARSRGHQHSQQRVQRCRRRRQSRQRCQPQLHRARPTPRLLLRKRRCRCPTSARQSPLMFCRHLAILMASGSSWPCRWVAGRFDTTPRCACRRRRGRTFGSRGTIKATGRSRLTETTPPRCVRWRNGPGRATGHALRMTKVPARSNSTALTGTRLDFVSRPRPIHRSRAPRQPRDRH